MEEKRNDAINNKTDDNYAEERTDKMKDVTVGGNVGNHESTKMVNEEVTITGIKIIVEPCDSAAEDEPSQEVEVID